MVMRGGKASFPKGLYLSTFEFCDGLFANGTRGQENKREVLRAVNGVNLTRALEFYELPRSTNALEVPLIFSHVDLGLDILDFFFDRAQDFLLSYELR
jgi:hypothetical protein